jgi:hypothetical protein
MCNAQGRQPVRGPIGFVSRSMTMSRIIPPRAAARLAVCLASLTVLAVAAVPAAAQEPAGKDQPVSFWMKKKLDYSQGILGGIATADFDKIVKNTESMRSLSKVEGFVRRQTPGYATQLQIFEQSADEILRQANRDNLDGAALAFTQLAISCVNCHKRLREAK